MNEYYLGYHIRANAELNLAADFWIPTVDISWDMHGKQFHQRLTGRPQRIFCRHRRSTYLCYRDGEDMD